MPRSTPHLGAWTVIPASPSWGDAGAERALDNKGLGGVAAVSWCEHEGRVTSSRRQGEFSPFGVDAESRTLFDSPHETRSTSLASSPGGATASASAHRRGSRGSADVAVGSPWIRKDGGVEVVGIRAAAQTLACLVVPRVPGFGHHPLLGPHPRVDWQGVACSIPLAHPCARPPTLGSGGTVPRSVDRGCR